MTDRPIIFSAPMVLALLAGRKTQTRRVLTVQDHISPMLTDQSLLTYRSRRQHYSVGDRLWVKEAHRFVEGGTILDAAGTVDDVVETEIEYRADAVDAGSKRWRPSIHIPRSASRVTLSITELRVQRLQDITEADARAEGIYWSETFEGWTSGGGADETVDFHGQWPEIVYRKLWNRLHGDGAWGANPWVIAITFTVAKGNIDG